VILALAFGEFILDLHTPLGLADWTGYFIFLLLGVFAGGLYLPYLLAGIFSALILVGYHFSPSAIKFVTNRQHNKNCLTVGQEMINRR